MLVGIGALWGQVVRVRVGNTGKRVDCDLGGGHGGRREMGKQLNVCSRRRAGLSERLIYGALPDSPALALVRYRRVLTTALELIIEERSHAPTRRHDTAIAELLLV